MSPEGHPRVTPSPMQQPGRLPSGQEHQERLSGQGPSTRRLHQGVAADGFRPASGGGSADGALEGSRRGCRPSRPAQASSPSTRYPGVEWQGQGRRSTRRLKGLSERIVSPSPTRLRPDDAAIQTVLRCDEEGQTVFAFGLAARILQPPQPRRPRGLHCSHEAAAPKPHPAHIITVRSFSELTGLATSACLTVLVVRR